MKIHRIDRQLKTKISRPEYCIIKLLNDVNQLFLSTLFAGADAEEEYQKVVLGETRALVVDEIQEDRMICNLCEEKGILVSKKSAQQAATPSITICKRRAVKSYIMKRYSIFLTTIKYPKKNIRICFMIRLIIIIIGSR